jgi:Pectate lyase superfamily protein
MTVTIPDFKFKTGWDFDGAARLLTTQDTDQAGDPASDMGQALAEAVGPQFQDMLDEAVADGDILTPAAGDLRYVKQADAPSVNPLYYGAMGDGVTDDTAALQAALGAAGAGGVVQLEGGATYMISSPLVIPPNTTLRGTHGNRIQYPVAENEGMAQPAMITASAAFIGTAMIRMLDKEEGGYAKESVGQRLENLTIDGSALARPGTIRGIYATGKVREVILDKVCVQYMPHNGIGGGTYVRADTNSYHPYSWYILNSIARTCGNYGVSLSNFTDTSVINCQAIGCTVSGFFLSACANSVFTNLRSEWNNQRGFHITGSWGSSTGSGGAVFTGLTTDRNTMSGIYVDATGPSPLVFNGMQLRRDGRNNGTGFGSYAGFTGSAATCPIIISNITTYPGVDDDGSGVNSPQYGVRFSGCTYVCVTSGFLHAASAGWSDGGTNIKLRRGPHVAERTGTTAAPTDAFQNDWTVDSAFRVDQNSATPSVFAKNSGGSGGHALTAYQAATAGTGVAINAVSDNSADSAMYLTGTETGRGTLKISHLGYADGSDANASGISIDMRTTVGGVTGSQAGGIFITSTTDAGVGAYAMKVRQNSRDDYILNSSGKAGYRLPIATAPAGVLEVRQGDDSTIGLVLRANSASATNLLEARDSTNAIRTRIDRSGNLITGSTTFIGTDLMLGATSSQFGGGAGGALGVKNITTVPTTNPSGGGVFYATTGRQRWRDSDGNKYAMPYAGTAAPTNPQEDDIWIVLP